MSDEKTPDEILREMEDREYVSGGCGALETTIRNERSERSNSAMYNASTQMVQLIHEEYNAAYNHRYIIDRWKAGMVRDISEEPSANGAPVVICGSGPSLDDQIEHLRDWRGGIVCSTSHALTLMRYGIEPTHIMSLDPFCYWEAIEGVDWSKTRTKLIATPTSWPTLIENWPNEILLFRQNNGRPDSFFATTLRNMYTEREGTRHTAKFHVIARTECTMFACSPPAQLFLADRLGYGTAVLAGVDFAFHGGKQRFTGYTVKRPAQALTAGNAAGFEIPTEWERHDYPFRIPEDPEEQRKFIVTNNGLYTEQIHLYYRKNMMSAWRLSCKNLITADEGAMVEVPHMPIEKIIKRQDKLPVKRREWIIDTTEKYLASVGAWVVTDENGGHNFVESEKPEEEIGNFITGMMRVYDCPQCQTALMADKDEDQTGEDCPQCKSKGSLKRRNNFDRQKNMHRIRKLMAWRDA